MLSKPYSFQEIILALERYWADYGCVIYQPYDMEKGAGTFNPATFLKSLGPEPWKAAYVEPSRRPTDGRYGDNPNRLQHYYQYQVIIKPAPADAQDIYLESLKYLGIDLTKHDIRFVEDDWESPTLGATGLGWEVWINGMEITQFTYFQKAGNIELNPISLELTYGLERIAMFIQKKDSVYDLEWVRPDPERFRGEGVRAKRQRSPAPSGSVTYGQVHHEDEVQFSRYNFEKADIKMLFDLFEMYAGEVKRLMEEQLVLPAYDYVLKCSHTFNLLDARGAIGTAQRTTYIARIRELARKCALGYVEMREKMGFPLLAKTVPADK